MSHRTSYLLSRYLLCFGLLGLLLTQVSCKEGSMRGVIIPRYDKDQRLPVDIGPGIIAVRATKFSGLNRICEIKPLERFQIKSAKEASKDLLAIELQYPIPNCAVGTSIAASRTDVIIENIEISNDTQPLDQLAKEDKFSILAKYQFPVSRIPALDYTKDGRGFGARRDATRLHAANDLIGSKGQSVIATASGTIKDFYEFYCGTFALVVDHGSYIALYGEVASMAPNLKVGSQVQKGQKIATLGQLCEGFSMLHFEKYTGSEMGPLTVRSNSPFQRRKDLVSPTTFLKKLEMTVTR